MFILQKTINLYFLFVILQVHTLLLKTKLGFMPNNLPWHIAYAMVLGLEHEEFDEHSLKAYIL